MSIKQTKIALIKHLNTLLPLLPTGYEASSFAPPTGIYQRVQFSISRPKDTILGVGYVQQSLQMQIFVNAPINLGDGTALDKAELLQKHFRRGLTLVAPTGPIHVFDTPQIAGTMVVGDRAIVPVIVQVLAEYLCQ